MRFFYVLIFAVGAAACTNAEQDSTSQSDAAATPAGYSAAAYGPCSACHLPDGNGIPGAFPRIRDRAQQIANLDGGRKYLVAVVAYGLMGPINIDGTQFAGVMPGHGSSFTADNIASVLNYIVFELTDSKQDSTPFSTDEVTAFMAEIENKSPAAAAALRKNLAEMHGSKWPD